MTTFTVARWDGEAKSWVVLESELPRFGLAVFRAERAVRAGALSVRILYGLANAAEWVDGKRVKDGAPGTMADATKESRDRGRKRSGNTMKWRAKAKPAAKVVKAPKPVGEIPATKCQACGLRWRQDGPYCRACARARGDMRTTFERDAERLERMRGSVPRVPEPEVKPNRTYVDPETGVEFEVVW